MKVGDLVRLTQAQPGTYRPGTLAMPQSWRGLLGLIVEVGVHPQSTKDGWWSVRVHGSVLNISGTTRLFHEDYLKKV